MTPSNKALLHVLTAGLDYRYDTAPTIELTARDLFNTIESVHEVWHSPSGFKKDDAKSVGFIRLPHCVGLNEINSKFYRLSELSTKITHQFVVNHKQVIKLDNVGPDVQAELLPALFIK